MGGYSGGMKRRLDLALALVHSPRILFLDEPTTGLDPQSRAALWEEVARLAHDEGMTVFLTTQYLEEADVLADRIGIIDHGQIVAEGTPDAAEGGDRQPERRGDAGRPGRPETVWPSCSRASASCDATVGERHRAAPRRRGRSWPRSSALLDQADLHVEQLSFTSPRSTTCSWPRPGRKLEGSADEAVSDEAGAGDGRDGGGVAVDVALAPAAVGVQPGIAGLVEQTAAVARRAVLRTLRQRALLIFPMVFPLILFAINGSALSAATQHPRLPDRQLPRLPDRDAVHAGRAVRRRSPPASTSPATSSPAS